MAAAHLKCYRLYIVSHTIGTDKSTDLFVFPISSWRVGSSFRTQLINDIERDTLAYTPKNIYFALHFMLFLLRFPFLLLILLWVLMFYMYQTLSLYRVVSIFLPISFFLPPLSLAAIYDGVDDDDDDDVCVK